MPFLVQISPTGKPIYIGGAAEDINTLPQPELLGESVVDKTIASRKINSVAGYATGSGTMRAGSLVLEAILQLVQDYRESLQDIEPTAQAYNIDELDENLSALFPASPRVGNIINEFKVGGVNSYQLLYDGTGWFAGGKISWTYVNDEAQLVVDGEIVARTGQLINLDVEGMLTIGDAGSLRFPNKIVDGVNLSGILNRNGLKFSTDDSIVEDDTIAPLTQGSTVYLNSNKISFARFDTFPSPTTRILNITGDLGGIYFKYNDTKAITFGKGLVGSTGVTQELVGIWGIENTQTSTSLTTGAFRVSGGIGIGGASWFGSTVIVGAATADNHALNRITGDGRYLKLDDIAVTGQIAVQPNESITITIDGSTYRLEAEFIS